MVTQSISLRGKVARLGAVAVLGVLFTLIRLGGLPAHASERPTCHGHVASKVGTAGRNVIRGGPGNDVIVAKGGNDVVYGGGGHDTICGGAGKDKLFGGNGADVLVGGLGWKIDLEADSILYASIAGLLSGLLGALYPALRAASQDPVEALSYE